MDIAVFAGGRSPEHDISLRSAQMVLRNLDRGRFRVWPVFLDLQGLLWPQRRPLGAAETWTPGDIATALPALRPGQALDWLLEHAHVQAVFPVLHGPYGEDGTVQGMLELYDLPFVGSGCAASAVAMDKLRTRQVLRAEGLPQAHAYVPERPVALLDEGDEWERLLATIGVPCFCKVDCSGSSRGVVRVQTRADFAAFVQQARGFRRWFAEVPVPGEEITVAVLGNSGGELQALPPVGIYPRFCDHFDERAEDTTDACDEVAPPRGWDAARCAEVMDLAVRCHRALGCDGMSRTDMIVGPDGPVVLEVNTIPGLTEQSLLPKAAAAAGIALPALLDRLVELALLRTPARRSAAPAPAASAPTAAGRSAAGRQRRATANEANARGGRCTDEGAVAISGGRGRNGLGAQPPDRRQPKTVTPATNPATAWWPTLQLATQEPATSAVPAPAALPVPPPVGAPTDGGGFVGWLYELASRPGVVETLLALLVCGIALLIWLRLLRVVETVRSRAQLNDYLLGVEQALAGDLAGAHKRLLRVLESDPENHYARLLLGKVLAQLGEPAQAHKHHLYLQRAFGVASGENDLQLAKALLLCDRPAEAAAAAERVVAADPQNGEALEFLFRTRLQTADHQGAAAAGRRLLALSDERLPGGRGPQLRADVAAAVANAGSLLLRSGEVAAAELALQQARGLSQQEPEVRLLAARVDASKRGVAAVAQQLLAAPPPATTLLPAASGTAAVALPLIAVLWQPLAPFVPPGRWRCSLCGAGLTAANARCGRCAAQGRAEVDEPNLFVAVEAPAHLADAIEANQAHVRRTVRAALTAAAGAPGDGLRHAVMQLGDKAVGELLAAACGGDEPTTDAAIALLRQLGPPITPALFAAADELEDRRLLPLGAGPIAHVVGRVVQGFDRQALPHVEALFASARPSSRKILIDYFLGLADPNEFQIVLERFPPLEILHRLNKIDGAVLRRFLQAVPEDHFVAEVLLLESTFYREDELLAAIPGAARPDTLERVLVQRGPSRTLTNELLRALGDSQLQPVALRVLRAFSGRVLDHLLSAFLDRDRTAEVRARLAELLAGLGPAAVDRLCGNFGPEPTSLDDELRSVLVAMGDAAVPALQSAYVRPGLVERLTVGLFGRGSNRRTQIVRALATLTTPAALAALRALRESESDPNMKLRLQQALHRLEEQQLAAGADDGDGGTGIQEQAEGGRHGQVG